MNSVYKAILNERIEHYGVSTLADEEAISVLTGIPLTEIKENLDRFGLAELIKYAKCMNITKAQKKKLDLIYHLTKRISISEFKQKPIINSSTKAGEYFVKELQFLESEVFNIAFLDSQNRLIKAEIVSKGTINEAPVYPREVIKMVLYYNANSVIIAHNHPGGSLQPSAADLELTKKLTAALKNINVKLIDHIIVAENKYTSLAEKGLIN